jgi:hypothetical protein
MPQVWDAEGITPRPVGATLPPVMPRVVEGGLSPQNCMTGVRVGVTIEFQICFRLIFQSLSSGGSPNTSLKLV